MDNTVICRTRCLYAILSIDIVCPPGWHTLQLLSLLQWHSQHLGEVCSWSINSTSICVIVLPQEGISLYLKNSHLRQNIKHSNQNCLVGYQEFYIRSTNTPLVINWFVLDWLTLEPWIIIFIIVKF